MGARPGAPVSPEELATAPWWKGWAIPIAMLDERRLLLRVISDFPSEGTFCIYKNTFWRTTGNPHQRIFLTLDIARNISDVFQMNLLSINGKLYVDQLFLPGRSMITPEDFVDEELRDPFRTGQRRDILWVIFELIGVPTPFSIERMSPSVRAQLFLPRMVKSPSHRDLESALSSFKSKATRLISFKQAIGHTNELLDLLRRFNVIQTSHECDNDPHGHSRRRWRIYGSGIAVDIRLTVDDEFPSLLSWQLLDSSFEPMTPSFTSPLEALEALPTWWPEDDPDGYIERILPRATWWPDLLPLVESYFLLNADLPVLLPSSELEAWVASVGWL